MKTLAIIPARYGSTRFPGKPLINIQGKTMIQRVFEKASAAREIDRVIVATDNQKIYDHVLSFGGEVMMTDKNHKSGTDRCGEVAGSFTEFDTIINIQGDEPFVPPEMIEELVLLFKNNTLSQIGTLVKIIEESAQLMNPNIVKAVLDQKGRALYFSRLPIPFQQGVPKEDWLQNHTYFKHIGMYIFNRKTLLEITKLPPGNLEKREKLEQLRWLENGYSISAGITKYESKGIDTPKDLDNIKKV